jgi:hypothetical protein
MKRGFGFLRAVGDAVLLAAMASAGIALIVTPPASAVATCTVPSRCVTATPDAATNQVGTTHTVSVGTTFGARRVFGCPVLGSALTVAQADITSGPNAPRTIVVNGTVVVSTRSECDFAGSFSYPDTGGAGTDTIVVTFGVSTFGTGSVTVTKTWVCPAGQSPSGTSCVSPPPPATPQFGGIAFALGGQGGFTELCDPGTCPTGPDDDLTPANPSTRPDDTVADTPADLISDVL